MFVRFAYPSGKPNLDEQHKGSRPNPFSVYAKPARYLAALQNEQNPAKE
jgi:hypothetical protein